MFWSGKTAGRPGKHGLGDSLTYFGLSVGSTTSIRKYFATLYFYFYFLSIGYRHNPFKGGFLILTLRYRFTQSHEKNVPESIELHSAGIS